jgi:5-(carboxyamino)imidazole ribonucleotide synthase
MKKYFQPDAVHIGVLGGGQLGRMMIQSGISFNLSISCIDPDKNAPCKTICTSFVNGDLNNYDDVYAFGKDKDIITIEIENVNVEALKQLEAEGKKVFPQPHIIELIKDKGLQKIFYKENQIASPPFFLVENKNEIDQYKDYFPFFQKLRTGGYDGKGVTKLSDPNELDHAFDAPCVLEQFVDFDKEISVIAARNEDGEIKCFPVVECEFNPEANLVEFLFSPANVSNSIESKATELAQTIVEKLQIVGILAIEMFVTKSGEVLVNEIAPRPHNSGHQTIEGNVTSQFEQHLRAILNLPLGDTSIIQPSVMINLLGEKGYTGSAKYEGITEAIAIGGVYPHLYGKLETKPFRKMGHVTIVNKDLETAKSIALNLKSSIKIIA